MYISLSLHTWSKEEIHVVTNDTITAFMKICPWGLQHYTNLLLGKITDIVKRIFHSGSSNIIIFFMGTTLLMCQDWINENGLFVWIGSKIYQHWTVKLQEQDLRLGTKLGDWIRKRFDDSSSRRDTSVPSTAIAPPPLTAFVFDTQLTGPWIHRSTNSNTVPGGVQTSWIVWRKRDP